MKIIELYLDEENDDLVDAISLVSLPAIEENFLSFNKSMSHDQLINLINSNYDIPEKDFFTIQEMLKKSKPKESKVEKEQKKIEKVLYYPDGTPRWYQYSTRGNGPPTVDNSHDFCREMVNNIYSVTEINTLWGGMSRSEKDSYGFINDNEFFKTFNPKTTKNWNIDQQIFNCRHYFKKVVDIKKLLANVSKARIQRETGVRFESNKPSEVFSLDIKDFKKSKKTICGAIMKPNMLIYRDRINGIDGECYVYFSKETVRKMYEQFKVMKSTIQHERDVEGIILSKSWIYTKGGDNYGYEFDYEDGTWVGEMRIANPKVWSLIEDGTLKGFSIEVMASPKQK